MKNHRHLSTALAVAVVAIATTVGAAPALAANSVYWGTESESALSFANLDGSGGGKLATTGATVNEVFGVAVDAKTGKIYWANFGGTISYANLDGSGGGDLSITGATVSEPYGIAIDTEAGRIYWANSGNNTIAFANLDGSGGGSVVTTGATVENPAGVAIDPAEGRIYWANFHSGAGSIAYANLNGTGGGNLATPGASVEGPEGVAIDPAAGKIYWGNYSSFPATIGFANLNGTGGADLVTTGATVENPAGVAIDPVGGRIYWADSTGPVGGISYANLNNTGGGGNLPTGSAAVDDPAFPALLEVPSGAGAPTITPTQSAHLTAGSMQTCTEGSWAPDVVSEFFYRSPQSYAFSWQLNGAEIAGANAETFTPTQPGLYSCRVRAANQAGSSTQTSAPVQVKPSNEFTIGKVNKAKLSLTLASAGKVRVTAILPKFARRGRGPHSKPPIKPSTASGGPGAIKVPLRLTSAAKKTLKRKGKLQFKASVTFTPTGGDPRTKIATLRVKGHRKMR